MSWSLCSTVELLKMRDISSLYKELLGV
jgi:hypothetical protein